MNAAWKQSIPILTDAASKGALAGAFKLFALFSAIILLSFFVMVDISSAAQAQKSAVRAPATQPAAANSSIPAHTPAPQQAVASIKVITPQAGALLNIGNTKTIEWQYSNLPGTVRVLLYKGGAPTSAFPLASATLDNSGKGTVIWAINPDLKPGNDYTIVIESNNKPGVKGVSAPFSLIDRKIAEQAVFVKKDGGQGKNEVIRYCPQTVTVDNIGSYAKDISAPPGFTAVPTAQQPTTFTVQGTNDLSGNKDCRCEYRNGDRLVQLRADMTGYTNCKAGDITLIQTGITNNKHFILLYR